MNIDKQLIKLEFARLKDKFYQLSWFCRIHDSQCAWLVIILMITTVASFTTLLVK